MHRDGGFTIIELLIVVVVVGMLAALVFNSFGEAQRRSKIEVTRQHLKAFQSAISSARMTSNKRLSEITGSNCTLCTCTSLGSVRLEGVAKTDNCWVRYRDSLAALVNEGAVNIGELQNGDPWGSPYLIDENEGETGDPCVDGEDVIESAGPDRLALTQADNLRITIPRYTEVC